VEQGGRAWEVGRGGEGLEQGWPTGGARCDARKVSTLAWYAQTPLRFAPPQFVFEVFSSLK